jgi:glycosyltransferase involved in cell wall biosynthesis
VSPEPIAYILGTFPQPSQTFIAREIRGLRQCGIPILIFALTRRPREALEEADRIWYDDVHFVPRVLTPSVVGATLQLLGRSPSKVLRACARVIALPHRPRVLALRAIALSMAATWIARTIERLGGCRQVHAHFALAQTEVAMVVSALLGRPFSFTAHARDIYATPSALEAKMQAAATVVTCTAFNVEHLRGLSADLPADRIQLVHHGVDASAASRVAARRQPQIACSTVPVILAAGRLVEKKGFDTLIAACGQLRRNGIAFRCRIYGTGSLLTRLRRQVVAGSLTEVVELPGWISPDRLLEQMGGAAVFAMPSRVSRGGDRDGIPNVVLEAMASGVPVVATRVSGIPEAIVDDVTGLLVQPDNAIAFAHALQRILTDDRLAAELGARARARIDEEFTLQVASERLARLFGFTARQPAMMNE